MIECTISGHSMCGQASHLILAENRETYMHPFLPSSLTCVLARRSGDPNVLSVSMYIRIRVSYCLGGEVVCMCVG